MTETDVVIQQTITCAVWLIRRGFSSLALELRNDMMGMWELDANAWDAQVDLLMAGDMPEGSVRLLQEVRYE